MNNKKKTCKANGTLSLGSISTKWFFVYHAPDRTGIWNAVFEAGEKPDYQEKNLSVCIIQFS